MMGLVRLVNIRKQRFGEITTLHMHFWWISFIGTFLEPCRAWPLLTSRPGTSYLSPTPTSAAHHPIGSGWSQAGAPLQASMQADSLLSPELSFPFSLPPSSQISIYPIPCCFVWSNVFTTFTQMGLNNVWKAGLENLTTDVGLGVLFPL